MTYSGLIKIALNALSARRMAKQVGVIADTDTSWKSALRRLRDARGQPLEGKSLAKARVRLGDLSNNSYAQLSQYSTRRLPSNTEIAASINPSSGAVRDKSSGTIRSGTAPFLDQSSVHSHPYGQEVYSGKVGRVTNNVDQQYRAGHPHRIASPSGYSIAKDSNKAFRDNYGKNHAKAWSDYQKFSSSNKYLNKVQERHAPGDVSTWHNNIIDKDIPVGPDHREKILAPRVNTVSVTRMKPIGGNIMTGGKRTHPVTIYFDHTPRKVRS